MTIQIDDSCGKYPKFRDLVECGKTQHEKKIMNIPQNIDSFKSLILLASEIIDPVINKFGMIKLTYGFASENLIKNISKNIYPKLDQHSSCEKYANGKFICDRLGAAIDFIIEDQSMLAISQWICLNTNFDRIYFYGDDKPIHVSHGPDNSRQIVIMREFKKNKKIPKLITISNFLNFDLATIKI